GARLSGATICASQASSTGRKGDPTETANPELVQIVPLHDQGADRSVLAAARVHRRLSVAEAARLGGIPEDEARWLEEGRIYRFHSVDAAMLALLLYSTALGIGHRVQRVRKATSTRYRRTVVYYEPGGDALGARLAKQLGVPTAPLPGGHNPRRLVVIVGKR